MHTFLIIMFVNLLQYFMVKFQTYTSFQWVFKDIYKGLYIRKHNITLSQNHFYTIQTCFKNVPYYFFRVLKAHKSFKTEFEHSNDIVLNCDI